MTRTRIAVGLLALSATAFVARLAHEGYTDGAVIPTKGDVPTVGFGSTVREDGTKVTMADRTTPVAALQRALVHVERDGVQIRRCIGPNVPLHQAEYDVYAELAYNIGNRNFCTNPKTGGPGAIPARLQARNYKAACDAILLYKYAADYDCSTPGNKRCSGVCKDRVRLHAKCMEAQ